MPFTCIPFNNREKIMTYEEANQILTEVNGGNYLKNEDSDYIERVFEAMISSQINIIEQKAREYLEHQEILTLKNSIYDKQELENHIKNRTFFCSMHEILETQFPNIDPSVEHDIPSWIYANAELVTAGYIKQMEKFISDSAEPTYKEINDFHQKFNFDEFESNFNNLFQNAWTEIVADIDKAVSA
jgi:hypothetical protein